MGIRFGPWVTFQIYYDVVTQSLKRLRDGVETAGAEKLPCCEANDEEEEEGQEDEAEKEVDSNGVIRGFEFYQLVPLKELLGNEEERVQDPNKVLCDLFDDYDLTDEEKGSSGEESNGEEKGSSGDKCNREEYSSEKESNSE